MIYDLALVVKNRHKAKRLEADMAKAGLKNIAVFVYGEPIAGTGYRAIVIVDDPYDIRSEAERRAAQQWLDHFRARVAPARKETV